MSKEIKGLVILLVVTLVVAIIFVSRRHHGPKPNPEARWRNRAKPDVQLDAQAVIFRHLARVRDALDDADRQIGCLEGTEPTPCTVTRNFGTGAGTPIVEQLKINAKKVTTKSWPRPVLDLYLGHTTPEAVLAAATDDDKRCQAQYYIGEWHLLPRDLAAVIAAANATGIPGKTPPPSRAPLQPRDSVAAAESLAKAVEGCNKGSAEYKAADARLKQLRGQTPEGKVLSPFPKEESLPPDQPK
jgi:hypothetical protein